MNNNKILCSISTRNRYFTTLPLVISAIINQTKKPDRLVIFDDNDEPKDMREEHVYQQLFQIMDLKGIEWEWLWAGKKGQHYNHQMANTMKFPWVWRVDDDTIPEPNTLKTLCAYIKTDIGAIGGSVLTPPLTFEDNKSTGLISNIYSEPNIQWGTIKAYKEVDHLHCTFLYRAGIHDYNLGLSRVAHREETLFTYGIKQKGWKVLAVPDAVCWHFKSPSGGIRDDNREELFKHDEEIFTNTINLKDHTIVVLNNGMGDHIVFKHVLSAIKNPIVFSCYPEIVPGRSIQEATNLFGDIEQWNIYRKMDEWNWKDSLEQAFRKMYVK
jgi:Glycosyltransferase like family 2